MEKVTIVIPIYKSEFTPRELMSMENVYKVLGDHKIVVIKPRSLELPEVAEKFPGVGFRSFADDFFDSIDSYNRLMLSEVFYRSFDDSEYILIHQLDAWIFRDELLHWCDKGYDYVGAPWLPKPHYRFPVVKQLVARRLRRERKKGRYSDIEIYYKVGNGGLSLRKVSSHLDASVKYASTALRYLASEGTVYNEDVFWGVVPQEFKYPGWREALSFSFDIHPQYAYKLNKKRLPFGCHGWYSPKMKEFWRPIIETPVDK